MDLGVAFAVGTEPAGRRGGGRGRRRVGPHGAAGRSGGGGREDARRGGEERCARWEEEVEVLDVTGAMARRADRHPGQHLNRKWMSKRSDCLHWCMPAPSVANLG